MKNKKNIKKPLTFHLVEGVKRVYQTDRKDNNG